MKKAKKIFKALFIISIIFVSCLIIGSIAFYHITTRGVSLDTSKLEVQNINQGPTIYDAKLNQIKPNSNAYIKLSKLSKDTQNAFLCAEDKRFYTHKGIDPIRICGAVVSNIKTHSFSQGASTISQQLVKNTQLSNEKTISRKLKEIKLTIQLEKKYSKDEIFELYLNNIYFGNGCYGVENASKHYFNKSASSLTLSESALLAGSINAPSVYNIENKLEKAKLRRNLILDLMNKYEKISELELKKAKQEEPKLNISEISGNSTLYKNILAEASSKLNISENNLYSSRYKIYTNIDKSLSNKISDIQKVYNKNVNIGSIVIDNKKHLIVSKVGKNSILNNNWQPGSTIKPIIVYAPAIEKNLISPATKILDNKINISGYNPENADKKYHGYISVKTALSKSYNIPAVKLLNEIGIDYAKSFAKNLGIEFSETDNHLALALGGFSNGVSPQSLCDAYSAFANNGKFQKTSYISKITQNGKILYENKINEIQAMNESTAFLINDMLTECAKNGTAKRLSCLPFSVASKTGTVGKLNSSKNQIAYNIAYTPDYTILTIIQNETLPESINGATYPTIINKEILSQIYNDSQPSNFTVPVSVKKIKLDKSAYENNKLLENENGEYFEEYFSKENLPKKQENDFNLTAINSPNHKPILCFTINKNYDYFLIRKQKKEEEIIFSSSENNDKNIKFIDKTAKSNEIYTYFIKICEKSKNEYFFSNEISLKVY